MPLLHAGRSLALVSISSLLLAQAAMAQGGITTGGNTQRPIFVSGVVVMEDGRPLPEKAEIQLTCQTQVQVQGKTDSDGKFTVQLGRDRHLGATDASTGSAAGNSGFGGALAGLGQIDGGSVLSLMGCSLRAAIRTWRSEGYDLSRVRVGEPTDAGTLVIRNMSTSRELTVSSTSLKAPRDAKKELEKGREAISKRKPADAEKALRKAVEVYPEYAEAWQELGAVLQNQNKAADARQAYLKAIASDSKFASPYLSLSRLAALEQNWRDAADKSAALLQLEPTAYPQAHYYLAVAQYNLNDTAKALESAKRAVELDPQHTVPLAEQLLGVIYGGLGDHRAAAVHYRNYMEHVPPGTNVESVKALLAEAEKRIR